MSHQPGISQQSATSNQRASNQPSKPALLPHKGPPSIGSIRALGHTLARDVKLTHCRSCPRGPPGDPRHLDYRIKQPLKPRTGCCRATNKPPVHYTNLLRLFSDRSVVPSCGGRGKHQPSVGVPGAPRTSFNWPTHGLGRRACAAGGLANVCCAVFPRACPRTGNMPFCALGHSPTIQPNLRMR